MNEKVNCISMDNVYQIQSKLNSVFITLINFKPLSFRYQFKYILDLLNAF